jgi:hypothetical protein
MDFIVNELRQVALVSVLELELIDKKSLELLSLLDFDESLSPSVAHL